MSVEYKKKLIRIDQKEFNELDYYVVKHAFSIHNEFGRFCDEVIYKKELALLLKKQGFDVQLEVPVYCNYKDYTKIYYLDLVVNNKIIYELKTVADLNKYHKTQLINYLLLTNLKHGNLLNFRSSSVEKEFVSTTLDLKKRKEFTITGDNTPLNNLLNSLLKEWGAYLDIDLYKEAIIFFLGGKDKTVSTVDILKENEVVGKQQMTTLNKNTAFHLSPIKNDYKNYEKHICKLLSHTSLTNIIWVNFDNNNIQIKNIKK